MKMFSAAAAGKTKWKREKERERGKEQEQEQAARVLHLTKIYWPTGLAAETPTPTTPCER